MNLLLGIDGGQTSTKVCLYDEASETCWLTSGPPIDHMLTLNGQIKSKQGIQQALQTLLQRTPQLRKIESAFISISGVHKEHEEMIRSWIREMVQVDRIDIEGDVKANLAGATAGRNDGVLIIGGGGSIGYYADEDSEYVAGGYGHILGDEGSAYWIGLQAIKAGIRHSDGRGPETLLHDRVLSYFGESSFWGIKKRIHADLISRGDIANLAMLVDEVAAEGDEAAQDLLRMAGFELGQLAILVLRQIKKAKRNPVPNAVYPTGGVLSSYWTKQSMEETILKYDPSVIVCMPQYPPVVGAVILAAKALHRTIDFSKVKWVRTEGKHEHFFGINV